MPNTDAETISRLRSALDADSQALIRYTNILAEDAIKPLGSYVLDNETMDRDKWRKTIADIIRILTENIERLLRAIALLSNEQGITWLGKPARDQIPIQHR